MAYPLSGTAGHLLPAGGEKERAAGADSCNQANSVCRPACAQAMTSRSVARNSSAVARIGTPWNLAQA